VTFSFIVKAVVDASAAVVVTLMTVSLVMMMFMTVFLSILKLSVSLVGMVTFWSAMVMTVFRGLMTLMVLLMG